MSSSGIVESSFFVGSGMLTITVDVMLQIEYKTRSSFSGSVLISGTKAYALSRERRTRYADAVVEAVKERGDDGNAVFFDNQRKALLDHGHRLLVGEHGLAPHHVAAFAVLDHGEERAGHSRGIDRKHHGCRSQYALAETGGFVSLERERGSEEGTLNPITKKSRA